ncbi:MAG: RNA 2',3'-cyclic phosphodiesterase [Thermoleophilia bacterium]|nr:RNA 2',3'-cyclic phosphodiesterase [Thermoleophilia bacterium]
MARDFPARPSRRQGRGERYAEGRGRPARGMGGQRQGPSYRLFVAVEIPAEAIRGLVGWQHEYLAKDKALRLTPVEQLHITLAFLGQKDEDELDQTSKLLDELESRRAFEIEAKRLVGMPRGRSPRVIAVECMEPSGRLKAIHDELAAGLAAKGLYKPEKREFFPHVTVARARGRSHIDLTGITPETVKFTAVRVSLYNSILKASGALHEALKTVQLT